MRDALLILTQWQKYSTLLINNSSYGFAIQIAQMAEDDYAQYNNSHRAFLQAFLARSVLAFDEAKPILAAIMSAHGE